VRLSRRACGSKEPVRRPDPPRRTRTRTDSSAESFAVAGSASRFAHRLDTASLLPFLAHLSFPVHAARKRRQSDRVASYDRRDPRIGNRHDQSACPCSCRKRNKRKGGARSGWRYGLEARRTTLRQSMLDPCRFASVRRGRVVVDARLLDAPIGGGGVRHGRFLEDRCRPSFRPPRVAATHTTPPVPGRRGRKSRTSPMRH